MSDDLTISEEPATEEEIVEFETTSRSEYIGACYNAIQAVSELDTGIMTKQDEYRKKRIIRKSLRIIDDIISEFYDELFEDEED